MNILDVAVTFRRQIPPYSHCVVFNRVYKLTQKTTQSKIKLGTTTWWLFWVILYCNVQKCVWCVGHQHVNTSWSNLSQNLSDEPWTLPSSASQCQLFKLTQLTTLLNAAKHTLEVVAVRVKVGGNVFPQSGILRPQRALLFHGNAYSQVGNIALSMGMGIFQWTSQSEFDEDNVRLEIQGPTVKPKGTHWFLQGPRDLPFTLP